MELKESCEIVKQNIFMNDWVLPSPLFDKEKSKETIDAIKTITSFCQSVVEAKGMPKQRFTNGTIYDKYTEDYCEGFNAACDLWQVYLTNRMNILCNKCKKIFIDKKD